MALSALLAALLDDIDLAEIIECCLEAADSSLRCADQKKPLELASISVGRLLADARGNDGSQELSPEAKLQQLSDSPAGAENPDEQSQPLAAIATPSSSPSPPTLSLLSQLRNAAPKHRNGSKRGKGTLTRR